MSIQNAMNPDPEGKKSDSVAEPLYDGMKGKDPIHKDFDYMDSYKVPEGIGVGETIVTCLP